MAKKAKKAAKRHAGFKPDTLIVNAGRDPFAHDGLVNPPVTHASTVLFETLEDLERISASPFDHVYYGRAGTPVTFAFEEAVAEIEGGDKAIATGSGLAAIAAALMARMKSATSAQLIPPTGNTEWVEKALWNLAESALKPIQLDGAFFAELSIE